MTSDTYDRTGRPIGQAEASALLGAVDERRVRFDVVRSPAGAVYDVSTVHLVIDHAFGEPGGPVLFETAVRQYPGRAWDVVERYRTEAQAAEGHAAYVLMIEAGQYPSVGAGEEVLGFHG